MPRVTSIAKTALRNFKHLREILRLRELYRKYKRFTMIPESVFIQNLKLAKQFSCVEGDVVECGVWRGGMIAAICEHLRNSKKAWLFDSFEGLPPAKEIDGEAALEWQRNTSSPYYYDNCKAEIKFAKEAIEMSGQKDYEIMKGWFSDTLELFPRTRSIAILHLDCDWYDSVMACLTQLFPQVSVGGLIIVDDYYVWDGCSRAIHDYLSKEKRAERIHSLMNQNAYIVKK